MNVIKVAQPTAFAVEVGRDRERSGSQQQNGCNAEQQHNHSAAGAHLLTAVLFGTTSLERPSVQ